MRKRYLYLIAIVILVATKFSSAQTTTITKEDYWTGLRSGYTTTEKIFPRRVTDLYESLSGGKVTYSSSEVSEYLSKEAYRVTETVFRNGKSTVSEAIQIGTNRYCRENGAPWEVCYEGPPAALGRADETKYSVEKNNDKLTYIRTATLLKKENNKPEPTKLVTEDRFLLNSDMSIRERSIITTVSETNTVDTRKISKFEYGITIKSIEAPIK